MSYSVKGVVAATLVLMIGVPVIMYLSYRVELDCEKLDRGGSCVVSQHTLLTPRRKDAVPIERMSLPIIVPKGGRYDLVVDVGSRRLVLDSGRDKAVQEERRRAYAEFVHSPVPGKFHGVYGGQGLGFLALCATLAVATLAYLRVARSD